MSSEEDYSDASEAAVKVPRAIRTRRTPASPRRSNKQPTKGQQRVEKNSKKVAKPTKSKGTKPLLSRERKEEARPRTQPKSRADYKPPPLEVIGVQTKQPRTPGRRAPPMSPTPLAIADAKKKARAETGRRGSINHSSSIDSDKMRRDKYSLHGGSSSGTSINRDPVMQNRTFKSTTDQSEGACTEGLTSHGTRDTYDDTVGDTTCADYTVGDTTFADDTTMGDGLMGDATFSMEESDKTRSHRGIMQHFSSVSENTSFGDSSVLIKQQVAWGCIGLSAVQFAILTTQVLLCGIAKLAINPLIGPYPDAFSEWGGKNVYLLVEGQEYFRFITPIFLHVGYIHLLVNIFFQLETCAYLEREWGFLTWFSIYLISGFGSCLAASAIDSNSIAVCSSGAMMGLFGARISQAIVWTVFETKVDYMGHGALIFERLGGVVSSAAVLFVLTFLTYIDWSGHLGGLCTGLLVGFFYFSHALLGRKTRSTIRLISFLAMLVGGLALAAVLFRYSYYDEDLADACNYFRNLYVEGYTCECEAFR